MAGRPLSIGPQSGLNRAHYSIPHVSSTSGSGPTNSHPVLSQSSYINVATSQSSPSLRRSASLGGLHQFCNNMGLQFGSRGRRELGRPNSSAVLPSSSPSLRTTKKRSLASVFIASDPIIAPSSLSPKCSDELPVIDISKKHVSYEELDDEFVPKNTWARRCNMKLHPYHKQVAYMQAYDPISLESDRYTELLFQRLTNGSPSFHDYGKMPPAVVLDLGCGQGHWILHAANMWRNTEFVGLDIVDTTLPAFDTIENVRLVRGDFINYKFPFPDDTFDFVRMANLALCIPYDKWEFVLSQVRRVLAPGGRLELIDDDIYFPYGEWKGVELESVVPGSPLCGEEAGMKPGDDEMKQGEDTGDADLIVMNTEDPWAANSGPVTPILISKFANPRLAPSYTSRNSSPSRAPPDTDTSPTQDLTPRYVRTDLKSTISPKIPTTADWRQRSGLKTFSKPTTSHVIPPSLTARKDGNGNSLHPKRIREKVALLPPIRSITATFSLSSGAKYSPTWSLRTANTSPTGSDTSSIRTTDTSLATSIGSAVNKVDPKSAEWQSRVSASKDMESLFEKMLVEQYGIHPRPSEFILRVLGKVFHDDAGEEQARMTKSFHIELAPTGDQPGSVPVGGKERARDIVEDSDGMASTSTEMKTKVDVSSKPQKRNGVPVSMSRSSPWQRQDKILGVDRPRSKKEKDKDKKNESKQEELVGRKFELKKTQAGTVKTTATITASLFKRSQLQDPALSTPIRPALSAKAAGILGIPYSELSVALSLSLSEGTVMPPPWSCQSNLSAKAAGRLGITYSEALSAAASLSVSRNAARPPVPSSISTFPRTSSELATSPHTTSGPVQHPGLLIWPDTYVPMAAGELEMHACKYVHTLLGCRPALEEFVAKFVNEKGERFVGEEELRDEIWEYECFRRARFNWPSEAAELYEDDPTNPNAIEPSSPVPCTIPNNSGAGSVDANHPTASTLDPSAIKAGSVSPTEFLQSTTHQTCTTDDFGFPKEKSLEPTNSSFLLRSLSPTGQRSPPPFMPSKNNSYTPRSQRSASPVPCPSPPLCSTKYASDQSITERNRDYRKLDDLVHLRSIRVFEGIKAT